MGEGGREVGGEVSGSHSRNFSPQGGKERKEGRE